MNLKPLFCGELNNENAATILFKIPCERAAVLEETTTRIIVSYPG